MSKKSSKAEQVQLVAPVNAVAAPVADEGVYGKYELAKIRKSPDNRKRFDEQALQELASSIKQMGVAQPILIRPVTPTQEAPEEYEIVAGERRYRASIIAGMLDIPAMCRTLSDLDAAKIRILENLQRENPHEMEEADGYQQLMLSHGFTAEQLAAEVHKSKAYIYARLKLCALAPEARKLFLDNKVSASIALLIARIPLPKIQVRAIKEVLEPSGWPPAPMSYRRAAEHIQRKYMLDLSTAIFDMRNAKLVSSAGACTKCPKRAGNQPEVFADVNADVCTDPDCFAEKKAAHYESLQVKAEKAGIPVLESKEGNAKINEQYDKKADLVTADLHISYFQRNAPHTKNSGTPRSLLPADAFPSAATLVRKDDGTLVALYAKAALQQALEVAGVCESETQHAERMRAIEADPSLAPAKTPAQIQEAARQLEHRENERKAAAETAYRIALYKKLRQRGAAGFTLQSLREFTKLAFRDNGLPLGILADIYDFDTTTEESIHQHIDESGLPEVQLLLIDMFLGSTLKVSAWDLKHHGDGDDGFDTVVAMAKHEGIDHTYVRIDLEMTDIALEDLTPGCLPDFVRVHPERINELKDFVIHKRPHMLSLLEAAAKMNGFHHTVDGFTRILESLANDLAPAVVAGAPAAEIAESCAAVDEPPPVIDNEDPPALAKKKPAKKASSTAPADGHKNSAWPFPKSAAEARGKEAVDAA